VLDAIYAAYGAGWEDPTGGDPARDGLTTEALRLVDALVEFRPDHGEVLGLGALLHHLEARARARRGENGEFIPLAAQDPWLWSPVHLAVGEQLLNRALATRVAGPYTLMAAISSVHHRRVFTNSTDWAAIARLYDQLLPLRPAVGVAVARAVALLESGSIDSAASGLLAIDISLVASYQPYWTVLAEVASRTGDTDAVLKARTRALELTSDPAIRAHLEQRWRDSNG
jgi:RNA polymerase sigma-70 factor (ECF subfamily)